MLFLITALILATALTIGLIANHFVRPFAKTEVQGVKLELLVSPLLTLTVLLLSFVLVQAFSPGEHYVDLEHEAMAAMRRD